MKIIFKRARGHIGKPIPRSSKRAQMPDQRGTVRRCSNVRPAAVRRARHLRRTRTVLSADDVHRGAHFLWFAQHGLSREDVALLLGLGG